MYSLGSKIAKCSLEQPNQWSTILRTVEELDKYGQSTQNHHIVLSSTKVR